MLSSFLFLFKILFLVLGVCALLSVESVAVMTLAGYKLAMPAGLFVLLIVGVIYGVTLLFRATRMVVTTPQAIKVYSDKKRHHKGMLALTSGLSAVAAGDIKAAMHYTQKAKSLAQDHYGLITLLSGLTARLAGDDKQSRRDFTALTLRDETRFMGLRGLMQTAFEKGDYRYARVIARQAHEAEPKQQWLAQLLFDLETRHQDWDRAEKLLRVAFPDKTDRAHHHAALYLAQGDTKRAIKLSKNYLPAVLAHASDLVQSDQRRKAMAYIQKKWIDCAHPELAALWDGLAPLKIIAKPEKLSAWVQKLDRDVLKDRKNYGWFCPKTKMAYTTWQPINDAGDFNTIIWTDRQSDESLNGQPYQNSIPPMPFIDDQKRAA